MNGREKRTDEEGALVTVLACHCALLCYELCMVSEREREGSRGWQSVVVVVRLSPSSCPCLLSLSFACVALRWIGRREQKVKEILFFPADMKKMPFGSKFAQPHKGNRSGKRQSRESEMAPCEQAAIGCCEMKRRLGHQSIMDRGERQIQ